MISEMFGQSAFGLAQMRQHLSREAYSDLLKTLDQGKNLTKKTADAIAAAAKNWAVKKGATHFCHWFQPMTGLTAEKHDAFITIQHSWHSDVTVMEQLSGSQLIQGEPDASSFPSGGMRSTFEARGYTAWDPNSPLFIVEDGNAKTLCIPSVFFGYHGQALDTKTPLLRSLESLSEKACVFLKLLGDVDVKSVNVTLGPEQEYFLVDKQVAQRRPDLMTTGRTLFGAHSARGQKLEDHYFGAIPSRVKAFMCELEEELFRLGVPIKTRHNEVAPSQFEMAPIFEHAAIASDHNILAMETMKRVADRHDFFCTTHEKPFAGLNGSGKHCNWSISNDKGENLLDPGKTPHQNLRFLALVAVVVKAVHMYSDVLAATITSPGNDLRLGGNEAPPTIISIFLGEMLEKIFNGIRDGSVSEISDNQMMNLGVDRLPNISRDYSDRNRTSPFAFTGNKFEFRAVGASAPVAVPVAVLNAAVASAFDSCIEKFTELKKGSQRDEAVLALIADIFKEHGAVIFNGNNYSDSWKSEAARRGLPVISSCADGFEILKSQDRNQFLVTTGVVTAEEVLSRYNVKLERYITTLEIELSTLSEMAMGFVVPSLERQLQTIYSLRSSAVSKSLQTHLDDRITKLEKILGGVLKHRSQLDDGLASLEELGESENQLEHLVGKVIPIGENLRKHIDEAEIEVGNEYWPLPKYRNLLEF